MNKSYADVCITRQGKARQDKTIGMKRIHFDATARKLQLAGEKRIRQKESLRGSSQCILITIEALGVSGEGGGGEEDERRRTKNNHEQKTKKKKDNNTKTQNYLKKKKKKKKKKGTTSSST
jgi:hypothetical protein